MDARAARRGFFGNRLQVGMCGQTAIFAGCIQARQILHDDPASPDIHMANFGIADLSVRQADIRAGSRQQTGWPAFCQCVDSRRCGKRNGIVGCLFTVAPAIHDAQHDGSVGAACVGRA